MKRFLKVIMVGASMSICLAAPLRAETLADAMAGAYEHSGLLEQNRALLRAADEDVALAVSSLRPILSWSADVTRGFGKVGTGQFTNSFAETEANIGIIASLLLYDAGRSRFQIDAAKETVLATRAGLVSIEQQVLLRAVQAFMNVRRTTQFVALRENNLRLIQQELRAAQDRFEVGEVTRTDVALAEARLAGGRSGLARAEGDLAQAIEEYRAVVGRAPGTLNSPGNLPNLLADVDAAKSVALRKHPDMTKAQKDIAAAEASIRASEAALMPQLSLQGRLGAQREITGDDYGRTGSIGLQLNAPIYQGGALSATTRRAVAQRDALRGVLHSVQARVQQDVGNAYALLRATRASVTASQEEVRAARVAFEGVREEATLGARTTLDVLDAEQDLLDAEANLISAQVDVFIAAYSVLAAMGELTAKDLRLNVQTYDPAAYYNLVKDAPVATSAQGRQLDRVLQSLSRE